MELHCLISSMTIINFHFISSSQIVHNSSNLVLVSVMRGFGKKLIELYLFHLVLLNWLLRIFTVLVSWENYSLNSISKIFMFL
jgi:hypothetical protein